METLTGFDIPTYKTVWEGVGWYYYLHIVGGTGEKSIHDRSAHGGQYTFYLFYATPTQLEKGMDVAADHWCKKMGLPCGIGDTIDQAYFNWQEQEKLIPLK